LQAVESLTVGADLAPFPVPFSIVFHGESLIGKSEIHSRDYSLPITDQVLRHRLKAIEHEVHAEPGLWPRFRSRIGQLGRSACGDNASIVSLSDHPLKCTKVNEPRSQHGVEISDRVWQGAIKEQV
jgi:hypothetical protein